MNVEWGVDRLAPLLAELGSVRPLLVTSPRLAELDVPVSARFSGVRRQSPVEDDLPAVAEEAAARPKARANPLPVSPSDVEGLLRTIW